MANRPHLFNITKEQMEKEKKNIIVDKEEYQCYQLLINYK